MRVRQSNLGQQLRNGWNGTSRGAVMLRNESVLRAGKIKTPTMCPYKLPCDGSLGRWCESCRVEMLSCADVPCMQGAGRGDVVGSGDDRAAVGKDGEHVAIHGKSQQERVSLEPAYVSEPSGKLLERKR
jgi:hypothetical protein